MEKSLKKETVYLYLIQFSNFLVPLAAFPYLTNKLGIEGFGKFGYAQTLFFLFMFLIDFGFILSGAKSISLNKENKLQVDKIYSNIQFVKFLIYTCIILILFISTYFNLFGLNFLDIDTHLLWFAIVASFSAILIPTYLFNGLSLNSTLAFITIFIKLVFLIPVFVFVKDVGDLYLAVVFQLMSGLIVGVIVQYLIFKRNYARFSFKLINKQISINETRQSYDNFIGSFFTLGFTYLTPLVIKFTLGDVSLGVYTVVDKLVNVLRQLYVPLNQAFFAKICIAYDSKDKLNYYSMIRKVSLFYLILGGVAFFGNLLLGEWLLPFIFGFNYDLSNFLSVAIATQIIISIASIIVNFFIIPSDLAYILKRIYFVGLLFYFPICLQFVSLFKLYGVFFSMLLIEVFILLIMLVFIYIKRFKFSFIDSSKLG